MTKTAHYFFSVIVLLTFCLLTTFLILGSTPIDDPLGAVNKTVKTHYDILKTWELPETLNEISAIVWLKNHKIAAVEDEDGIIFIYDLEQKAIVDSIPFGDDGDYEGLAIKGDDAFVMRSDGMIYEILNYRKAPQRVNTYKTGFKSKNNMESLFYDKAANTLLTVAKNKDPEYKKQKSIYKFSLKAKEIMPESFLILNLEDKAFKSFRKKNQHKTLMPSDLAINPLTGEIFILEGRRPKLVVYDKAGDVKQVFELDKDEFPQPEGICFSPEGKLYISNEAHKGPATILEVSLKK